MVSPIIVIYLINTNKILDYKNKNLKNPERDRLNKINPSH